MMAPCANSDAGGGKGEICVSAWVQGEIVFYGWVQFTERQPAPLTRIPIRPDGAFIYRCATEPAFRGRGIYTAALLHALRHLRMLGKKHAFIDHAVENHASRRGIEKAGGAPVGHYRIYCIGFRWARFDPAVRNLISGI